MHVCDGDRCWCLQLAKLLKEADAIGDLLRYRHQGFLANKRQLRMGGLAAIELAQMLRTDVSQFGCFSRLQTVPLTCVAVTCSWCASRSPLEVHSNIHSDQDC